jgi:hypothetical protein
VIILQGMKGLVVRSKFGRLDGHPTAAATGRTVHHLFTGRPMAENGQIKLLRESLNPFAVAQALLSGGVNHQAYRGSTTTRQKGHCYERICRC